MYLALSLRFSIKSSMSIDRHQYTKTTKQGDNGRAAVADQRQRYAHNGQYTTYHANIDKNIHKKGKSDASCY